MGFFLLVKDMVAVLFLSPWPVWDKASPALLGPEACPA